MQTDIDRQDLKDLLREVIREELLSLAINLMPYVSDTETAEIEDTYTDKDFEDTEFIEGMTWLGK